MKITKPKRVDKVWGMSYGFTMIKEYCGKLLVFDEVLKFQCIIIL